jgi:hypothetical protein
MEVRGTRRGRDRPACTGDSNYNRRDRDRKDEGDGCNHLRERNRTLAPAPLARIGEPDLPQLG